MSQKSTTFKMGSLAVSGGLALAFFAAADVFLLSSPGNMLALVCGLPGLGLIAIGFLMRLLG